MDAFWIFAGKIFAMSVTVGLLSVFFALMVSVGMDKDEEGEEADDMTCDGCDLPFHACDGGLVNHRGAAMCRQCIGGGK